MELLGVVFATGYLIAAVLYYTLLPTALNLALALLGTIWLCRGRSTILQLLCFPLLCLLLTFGTRLPDFIEDGFLVAPSARAIDAVVTLERGDTINVGARMNPVPHRSSYFGTPVLSQGNWVGRLLPARTYVEDVSRQLLSRGLRLNYGVPDPTAPTLDFESEATQTHQRVALSLLSDGRELGSLSYAERIRFLEETGEPSWPRLHLQHLLEDTLWNWIARIIEKRASVPVSSFLEEAIRIVPGPPVSPRSIAPVSLRQIELASLDEGILSAAAGKGFDCARDQAGQLPMGNARTTIVYPDYEVFVEWPIDDVGPDAHRMDATAGIERATCGEDGYLILLTDNGPDLRMVLADRQWRPTAILDFKLPGLARTGGYRRSIINLYQDGARVHLEALMKAVRPAEDQPPYRWISVELEHELLSADHGSLADRWSGLDLREAVDDF